jgi:hypothetical protein
MLAAILSLVQKIYNIVANSPIAGSGVQNFTASGTFTVPANITTVQVTMYGGGGGGAGSGDGGGGGGGIILSRLLL